jgi:hypothetical protein
MKFAPERPASTPEPEGAPEETVLPKGPRLRHITRALELLHEEPAYGPDGERLPPDPEKRWTNLHEKVKSWSSGLELSDNVREAVREFVAGKIPRMKEVVPVVADLPDDKLLEALIHNWFEGLGEEIEGWRKKILLAVMAHVVKRVETHAYTELLSRASPEDLGKLGLDGPLRDLLVRSLKTVSAADPLFIRFLAYAQLSGKVPAEGSPVAMFMPEDDKPHTLRALFPTESKRLGKGLRDIAASSEDWIDKPGAPVFKEYLEALSGLYFETEAAKAAERQMRVAELYGELVKSGFPVLLVPALEGFTKEPYLDPELRVCLATPDVEREEEAFTDMQEAMADSLEGLGAGEFSEALKRNKIRSVVAVGSYGVNLVFNAVAQERPATLMFLDEQIRQYDRNFPETLALVSETPEAFAGLDEAERRARMERMSRATTMFHEYGHHVFPEGSPEAGRFGDGEAWTTLDEVRAETTYRPLIPSMIERGRLEGTKEQWALSTLASAFQLLRDQPPGDPYHHAAAFTLNDLFEQDVVALKGGKFSIRDFDAYWKTLDRGAREVIAMYRDEGMTEAKAERWIKKRCQASAKVKEAKAFLEKMGE